MINVFKKRTRLYALTTSALFFLQGVDTSVAVSGVRGAIEPSLTPVGSLQSGCDPSYGRSANAGNSGAQDSSIERSPIHCDNKTFTVKGGQITVTEFGDNGVYATGSKAHVKIHNASIQGVEGEQEDDEEEEEGAGSAVYAVNGASVELVDSSIHTFETGLEATEGAVVNMKSGDIVESNIGVLASNNSSVFLGNTGVDVNATALYGMVGAGITMKSGTLTFPRGNTGIWSESTASVKLNGVGVKIKEAGIAEDEEEYVTVVFTSHDGFVAFDNGRLNVSDVIAFWIGDDPDAEVPDNLGNGRKISNEYLLQNVLNVPTESSGYDFYTIEEIAEARNARSEIYGAHDAHGEVTDKFTVTARNIIGYEKLGPFRISAGIKSSTIEVKGSKGVGINFEKSADERAAVQNNDDKHGGHVVVLNNASFKVPEGVAINDRDLKGSVFLTGKSELSGDLLLKATSSAHLSVFAHDSVIIGDVSIKDNASAKFFLSDQSEWRLTKSERREKKNGCVDLCIASLNLKNSTLKFISPENNNVNYRTLRIGDGRGVVYNADNAWIHFNVRLGEKYGSGVQVSDRLLIHGDVSGRTILHVNAISENVVSGGVRDGGAPSSVSLIQVHGKAQEDSFQLNGEYVTLNGYPYQYTLHVYGPFESPTVKHFDDQLKGGKKEFWDFRLENAEFVASYLYGYPYRSTVTYSLPPQREETRVVAVNDGEDDAAFNSAIEVVAEESEESESVNAALPVGRILLATPEPSVGTLSSVKSTVGSSNSVSKSVLLSILGLGGANPGKVKLHTFSDPNIGRMYTAGGSWSGVLISKEHIKRNLKKLGLLEESDNLEEKLRQFGVAVAVDGSLSIIDSSKEADRVLSSSTPASSEEGASVVVNPPISLGESQTSRAAESSSVSSESHISSTDVDSDSSPITIIPVRNSIAKTSSVYGVDTINPLTVTSFVPVSREPAPINSFASTVHSNASSELPASSIDSAITTKPDISRKSSEYIVGHVEVGAPVTSTTVKKTDYFQCNHTEQNGVERSQVIYLCSDGKTHTMKNLTLKASGKTQHPMHVKSENTIVKLEGATISGAYSSNNQNNIDLTQLQAVSAVLAEEGAEVVLEQKTTVQSSLIGLEAQRGGKVKMNDGTVNVYYVGALAGSGSSVDLSDTKINVTGNFAVAGLASNGGRITMSSGNIALTGGVAVRSESGANITLNKVEIIAKKQNKESDITEKFGRAAFLLSNNGSVDFSGGKVSADANVLWIRGANGDLETGSSRQRRSSDVRPSMNRANIESSTVRVEGDRSYGIYFDGTAQRLENGQNQIANGNSVRKARSVEQSAVSKQEKTPIGIIGTVSLKKTDFEVAKGIAIYGNNSGGHVSLENKTTLAGDLLLKAENDSHILVSVNNSIVTGGVRVDKSSYAKLDLANGSEWILKRSVQKDLGASVLGCVDSCVSSVRLINSAINFASSESAGKYQTLHIGNGNGTVYEAQGDAVIHLNARLNPHDSSGQQVTDRLIIHGDVSGKTKIHVRGDAGNGGNGQANAKIAHSVSIIQVYGQAKKDSFQLDGNYVALINSPYKYTLRAYGPEVTSKQGHVQQKFVKDGGEFWNFRLENQYVKSAGSVALPQQFIRSVVPQVPTYLVLPNSVFHAGLMDINNQSKQLETLRMTSTGMVEVRENPALYLRGYGGSYRYASDLSALEYGYGGDLDYRGVEAGVLLQTIENTDSALSFGVMGTYGNLSLQPLNVEQSQKSAFDKWTATVYGSMQHNIGFYVDGLLSYGLFNGDVLTTARGKTTTLKGNPLSVSLSGGQTIATGYKGFVFDPQVQVVYQHLQFNKARDIDNFDIEMGNLDQWVARVGGRLTKIPTGSEGVDAVAFYGKLYLAHGFGEKQTVHFSDSFKLGAFGSALEAGLGFNAKLLPQFSLHADILYQHKLNKAGFSGASFSGGVRYQF